MVLHLYARSNAGSVEEAVVESVSQVQGAFSFLLLTKDRLIAVRDPHGFRPLALGRLDDSFVVCSETCAMDLIGATYVRDVEPGEVLVITSSGMRSIKPFPPAPLAHCVFEHVYFARPDSYVFGKSVNEIRTNLGRILAREQRVDADVVVPVPDSGVCAAMGYADEAGIPLRMGLIRNHYVGRTFIQPQSSIRNFGVRVKLNPVRSILEGKRVVLVDDSIIRGTTSRKIVGMVRAAGAKEVHLRISCPPTISPCFYGVDTPRRSELIAATHTLDEICSFLEADSIRYLSLEGLLAAVGSEQNRYCRSCYTAEYPVPIPPRREVVSPTGAEARQGTRHELAMCNRHQLPRRAFWSPKARICLVLCICSVLADRRLVGAQEPAVPQAVSQEQLQAAIDKLGDLDYATRTAASRTVRRTLGAQAVPALLRAVATHADGYVRYRALVLLTGFNDARTKDAMRESLTSPNDRLRTVAYSFFEHVPDRAMVPELLSALETERAEFVRPALTRALAANGGDDERVQMVLTRESGRGEDFFRSAVIEALGDYRAQYALDAIAAIAKLDGPLQDDSALALGKIGDKRALPTLASLQSSAPRARQPAIAAAICLLGVNCDSHEHFLIETLKFADSNPGFQELMRGAAAGLAALGVAGRTSAVDALFLVGIPSRDPHAPR